MKLLTAKKVAEKLSISVASVYNYVNAEMLPNSKHSRWNSEDIDAWIALFCDDKDAMEKMNCSRIERMTPYYRNYEASKNKETA